jgi:hypothetical protein
MERVVITKVYNLSMAMHWQSSWIYVHGITIVGLCCTMRRLGGCWCSLGVYRVCWNVRWGDYRLAILFCCVDLFICYWVWCCHTWWGGGGMSHHHIVCMVDTGWREFGGACGFFLWLPMYWLYLSLCDLSIQYVHHGAYHKKLEIVECTRGCWAILWCIGVCHVCSFCMYGLRCRIEALRGCSNNTLEC